MVKNKIYPNYTDLYYYFEGEKHITLKRRGRDGKERFIKNIEFDSPEEAGKYFNEEVWK